MVNVGIGTMELFLKPPTVPTYGAALWVKPLWLWLDLHSCIASGCIEKHTHTHLTALFPGLPGWAGTRKVKPIWILLKQETEWQWYQLGHRQVCISLQTDNHASTPPLSFYRPDALPAAQPTASKHWRRCRCIGIKRRETDLVMWQLATMLLLLL